MAAARRRPGGGAGRGAAPCPSPPPGGWPRGGSEAATQRGQPRIAAGVSNGRLHNKPADRPPFPGERGLVGESPPAEPSRQPSPFNAFGQAPLVPYRTCFGGGGLPPRPRRSRCPQKSSISPASAAAVQESWRAPWARPTRPPVPALVRSLPAQQPPLPSPDRSPAAGGGGRRRTRRWRNEVSRGQIPAVAGIFKSLILFSSSGCFKWRFQRTP